MVKHEALAVRRDRERLLGGAARRHEDGRDSVALIPAAGDGPGERLERREQIARSREALQTLKPAELRALTLLAEGYSYAEIGEITGFSQTKVNRCLAEGRERFRDLLSRSEDGSRCAELGPLLSAFCDGEASAEEPAAVREHLRACAALPRDDARLPGRAAAAIAALAPALPVSRSLLERAHELLAGLHSRLAGAGAAGDGGSPRSPPPGAPGAPGWPPSPRLLAICAGTVGGAAACVATGVAAGAVRDRATAHHPGDDRAGIRARDRSGRAARGRVRTGAAAGRGANAAAARAEAAAGTARAGAGSGGGGRGRIRSAAAGSGLHARRRRTSRRLQRQRRRGVRPVRAAGFRR